MIEVELTGILVSYPGAFTRGHISRHVQPHNGHQEDPGHAMITDSLSILLLRSRERASERLPTDWLGTKYQAVKE